MNADLCRKCGEPMGGWYYYPDWPEDPRPTCRACGQCSATGPRDVRCFKAPGHDDDGHWAVDHTGEVAWT